MNIAEKLKADTLTVAECDDLLAAINDQSRDIQKRIAEIRPAGKNRPHGPERRKALESGTPEDVRKLDDEHADAVIRADQLQAQRDAVQRRRDVARAREAAEAVPQHCAELSRRLDALEAAQKALTDAWHATDAAYRDAWQARNLAVRGGHNPEGADPDLVARAVQAAAGGINTRSRLANLGPNTIAEELGVQAERVAA